jgi:hypothetical protein
VVTVTFLVVEDGQLPEPPVGIVPVAADDAYTTPEGQVLQVPAAGVLVNDSSDGADSIVPDTFTPPTHGMVNLLADGSLSYTPDAGFTGFDTFTYAVHAFVGGIQVATSELATVTIEVTEADEPIGLPGPQNLAPIAGDDNYAATSGVQLEVFAPGFLVNDSDPEGDAITFHLVTGAQHGTFQHLGSGWFRYTSDAGFVGADTVTYRAEEVAGDEKLSNLATITIEVTAEQLETQGVPCSPTQPGGCDEPGDEPGDESGDEPGSEISTLAYTGSDGSSWIVLASFLVIYAGGMAMRFARRHQVAVADEA